MPLPCAAPRLRQALFLLLLAAFASGCTLSRNPITGSKRPYGYSWAQEVQLGAEADQQIIQQFGLYDNPALQAYVEQVGQTVLRESHLRRPDALPEFRETPFHFRVLDSPVVNAFALPGGYIYLTRGLLTHLQNEAQLAVVLGHEIAHVAARHASERAFEAQLGNIALIGGAIIGQEVLGLPAQDLLNIGGTATQLLFLQYSREDEREADRFGVEYAALAGYQVSEAAEFFHSLQRLGDQEGGNIPGFLATHPNPGERQQTILELAQEWAGRASLTAVNQSALYERLDGVVLGENPRQGFVENNVFYHPDLAFQFPVPSGWQLVNQAAQVVMVAPQQDAYLLFSLSDAATARDAATAFARQQGLQVLESAAARVGSLPAYYVVADATTQQGQALRILAYFIEYRNQTYTFVGYTTPDAFSRHQSAFVRTATGFSAVTDPAVLNVQPVRVDVVAAPRTAAFSTFVPSRLPRDLTAQELAIMNQLELTATVQRGDLLKLPAN